MAAAGRLQMAEVTHEVRDDEESNVRSGSESEPDGPAGRCPALDASATELLPVNSNVSNIVSCERSPFGDYAALSGARHIVQGVAWRIAPAARASAGGRVQCDRRCSRAIRATGDSRGRDGMSIATGLAA